MPFGNAAVNKPATTSLSTGWRPMSNLSKFRWYKLRVYDATTLKETVLGDVNVEMGLIAGAWEFARTYTNRLELCNLSSFFSAIWGALGYDWDRITYSHGVLYCGGSMWFEFKEIPADTPHPKGTCPQCGDKGKFIRMALCCPQHGAFAGA